MQNLSDKVIMVTGAASGIGRAATILFASKGAHVLACDLNRDDGEAVVSTVQGNGGSALFCHLDITRSDQVQAAVDLAVRKFGRLDGAFNNAGYSPPNVSLLDGDESAYAKIMDVNCKGIWHCMRAQIPQLLKQGGGGSLVNTSSASGLRGTKKQAVYAASKHAVIGLTKSAALEFAKPGIRINAICPGVIETPMMRGLIGDSEHLENAFLSWQPGGRFGQPEEIAAAAAWLLSDEASFVTGVAMCVDGGVMA